MTSSPSTIGPREAPERKAPPQGSPWDDAIDTAPFALVDLEMTGLDVTCDRVIEICIERRRAGAVETRLESLVRPPKDTAFGTDVHGIDASMLRDAPPFSDFAPRIAAMLEGAVLVAHGAAWDVAFLEAELARAGVATTIAAYLDTLTLSRRVVFSDSHSLEALAQRFGIERRLRHRAGDDVRVLSELFQRFLSELRPETPRDLWHVRVGQKETRPDVLAACLALAETRQIAEIHYRPSHRRPRNITCVVTRVRTDLDPPRVMGYALPDRGRFQLRADRILWAGTPRHPDSHTEAP
jgi:DNA polymerase III subunit epsilon